MRLNYRQSFTKDLDALPRGQLKDELIDALHYLKEIDSIGELLAYSGVKKLRGHNGYYRLRIEKYRLGFRLEKDGSLTLLRFQERGEIYKYFP